MKLRRAHRSQRQRLKHKKHPSTKGRSLGFGRDRGRKYCHPMPSVAKTTGYAQLRAYLSDRYGVSL